MVASSETVEIESYRMRYTRPAIRALLRWAEDCRGLGHTVIIDRDDDGEPTEVAVIERNPYRPLLPITCLDAMVNRFELEVTPCL